MSEETMVCPYCWAEITMLVDSSAGSQRYVEDCEVCCHPIEVVVAVDSSGAVAVDAERTP